MPGALTIAAVLSLSATPLPALPSAHLFSPSTSLTVERLKLRTADRATLNVEALRSQLTLGSNTLAANEISRLCPKTGKVYGKTTLSCISPRLSATLDHTSGVLTVVELRGLPWRNDADGPPQFFYDPAQLNRPLSCPAETPLAKAECDYSKGQLKVAFQEFARIGAAEPFAELRMGDIALALDDPETALMHFEAAGTEPGPVSDLATFRRCELVDECSVPMLHAETYAAVFRPEMMLRIARWHAFHAELEPVLNFLAPIFASASAPGETSPCSGHEVLCRRLLLAALDSDSVDTQARALQVYLTLGDRLHGATAEELADAAAEISARLGVPRFGAHLLASVYPMVVPEHCAAHLLRTLELYDAANDRAHAEAIAEFAKARLPKGALRGEAWKRALKASAERATAPSYDKLAQEVQVNRDIAEAVRVKAALSPQEAAR